MLATCLDEIQSYLLEARYGTTAITRTTPPIASISTVARSLNWSASRTKSKLASAIKLKLGNPDNDINWGNIDNNDKDKEITRLKKVEVGTTSVYSCTNVLSGAWWQMFSLKCPTKNEHIFDFTGQEAACGRMALQIYIINIKRILNIHSLFGVKQILNKLLKSNTKIKCTTFLACLAN